MAWLTADEFKDLYVTESATEISSAQITQCLDEGIDEIASMCGEAVLTEIEIAVGTEARKVRQFRRAQGKLGYRALLLIMSARFRNGGILESERDMNSSATDKYVSFKNIDLQREALYKDAAKALENYLIVDVAGDNLSPNIEYSHPVQVDCCDEFNC
ncbi:MAG: hypothetical protein KG003_13945 [Bacteroidetes bacterium]|nr:hypothetical protein [Bacteroidota bacterium]